MSLNLEMLKKGLVHAHNCAVQSVGLLTYKLHVGGPDELLQTILETCPYIFREECVQIIKKHQEELTAFINLLQERE